ncbi:helix-turn-helix domain-containing protein [Stutzerimonas stutzeri]|uniref:helix-turn-helix transcriptional regulator n=1 Tax=Stutzerimonas sp. S1 TaxID=3030652 RepID=UPI0022247A24|nr:AraC family transcriptional regulator [Stutzerimonas sp. S1]MCW3148911.1 helix-turn-helix domain-containing protein [Stutzerimonas sp. S1]
MSNSPQGPLLLWVDLTHDRSTEALMNQFTAFSECRLVQAHSLTDSTRSRRVDMICMHFDRPDALGLNQLQQVKRAAPSIPISMFTVQHSEELAVWAMRSGVWEYVTLPLSPAELQRYRQALERLYELRQSSNVGSRRALSEHYPELPPSIRLTVDHQKHQLLVRATQYIDQHFCENLDQKELALLCGLTPSRFSRLFREVHGVCYLEYMLGKRLEFAKDRLDNTQMPITTIGYDAGFRDPSYFARAFKQFVGCTPSEYRNGGRPLAAVVVEQDLQDAAPAYPDALRLDVGS